MLEKKFFSLLVADDHPLVRTGVRLTLSRSADFQVIAEASSGDQALRVAKETRPDIILADIGMPGPGIVELVRDFRRLDGQLKVVVLTSNTDVKVLKSTCALPIDGLVLKDESPDHLLQALRVIAQGETWYSQSVRCSLWSLGKAFTIHFTPREKQLLNYIAAGRDNSWIAGSLNLQKQTVRNYAAAIYDKLSVTNRIEAAIWAKENGYSEEPANPHS